MLPYWIDFPLTAVAQIMTVFVALAGWLLMTLTSRHSGL